MRIALVLVALLSSQAFAQSTYVRPHVRSDGTYVQGHMRSAPDDSRLNNYSTQGNYNPYTGQAGTQSPYPAYNNGYQAPAYPQPSQNNNGLYQPYR